jgi:uncharacterized DUF497 family protein
MGMSGRGRLLVVWYTERGKTIRIIGSREADRYEIRMYENER